MATIPTTDSGLLLGSSALLRRTRRAASSARLPAAARRRPQLLVRASAKDIAFDQDSRASLQAGVEKLAAAVGVTLGPRGLFSRARAVPLCSVLQFFFFFGKMIISLFFFKGECLLLRKPINLR
jgi:hypothetical protein